MKILNKQTKQETIVYTIVWIVLFLSPLVSLIFRHDDSAMETSWIKHSLFDTWANLLAFLVVFLIHNHVLAPIIVIHKRVKTYLVACLILISVFQLAECAHRPNGQPLISSTESQMPPPMPPNGHPPIDKHDLTMFIIVVMMIGANLGVKAYFLNEEEKKHLAQLKEQSLKQQLDYLRYQINPHLSLIHI